jgi:hypothetical protein
VSGNISQPLETQQNANLQCYCGKIYSTKSGLWKHKQKCKPIDHSVTLYDLEQSKIKMDQILSDKDLVLMLLKDNNEFKAMMMEQQKFMMDIIKNGTHNTTNSHNKTFNLQVFLNETCKDAINLTDFVNQIKVSIEDLEETGKIGYVDGISKVFIKNLNGIDYTRRPIHCGDSKREILYIKEDGEWSKDDENKTTLTKAIKQVASKNIKQISEWQKIHPDYNDPDSKQNDKYMQIVLNSMSGSTKEECDRNVEKIVKNIAKETIIVK